MFIKYVACSNVKQYALLFMRCSESQIFNKGCTCLTVSGKNDAAKGSNPLLAIVLKLHVIKPVPERIISSFLQ